MDERGIMNRDNGNSQLSDQPSRPTTRWRHGVKLFDSNGVGLPHTPEFEWYAHNLLVEYATVRGLSPRGGVMVRKSDYNADVRYAMLFDGPLTADAGASDSYGSRLFGRPTPFFEALEGREERHTIDSPAVVTADFETSSGADLLLANATFNFSNGR